MEKNYWALFSLSIVGIISFILLFVLTLFLAKKIFLSRKYGLLALIVCVVTLLFFVSLCVNIFVRCCKDYAYVINDTYIKTEGKAIEFTRIERDFDGNGEVRYSEPKFLLMEQNEYIVLHAKNVELGKIYIIKYYPNTKICDVVKKESSLLN